MWRACWARARTARPDAGHRGRHPRAGQDREDLGHAGARPDVRAECPRGRADPACAPGEDGRARGLPLRAQPSGLALPARGLLKGIRDADPVVDDGVNSGKVPRRAAANLGAQPAHTRGDWTSSEPYVPPRLVPRSWRSPQGNAMGIFSLLCAALYSGQLRRILRPSVRRHERTFPAADASTRHP